MKRVFISLLVLAITSTAGAQFQIMVNGDKNDTGSACYVGDHFSLGIWTDTDILQNNEGATLALVVDNRMATIDYTSGIVVPPYNDDPGIFLEHSMSAAELFPLPEYEDGIVGYVAPFYIPVINTGSILFDDIDFVQTGFGIEVVKLYVTNDWETLNLVDTYVIMEIPEPMTIGLLGLGALFLRKRK
jgi:hypothetical protein